MDQSIDARVVAAMNGFQDYVGEHKLTPYETAASLVHLLAGFAFHQTKDPEAGVDALFKDVRMVLTKMQADPTFFFEREH